MSTLLRPFGLPSARPGNARGIAPSFRLFQRLADNPLGYWRLGEQSGFFVDDSSGHGHTGTYMSDPVLGRRRLFLRSIPPRALTD
ncbi:MAG: hypothetical protein U0793_13555 [Gemmataceae bacterium]